MAQERDNRGKSNEGEARKKCDAAEREQHTQQWRGEPPTLQNQRLVRRPDEHDTRQRTEGSSRSYNSHSHPSVRAIQVHSYGICAWRYGVHRPHDPYADQASTHACQSSRPASIENIEGDQQGVS
jgi:hypothetical protein